MFVVCPSRISTHSVSGETRIIASTLPRPPFPPVAGSRLVSFRLRLPRPRRRRSPSSFANEGDKTARPSSSAARAERGHPSCRSKWRRRYSLARARGVPLASSCAIRPGIAAGSLSHNLPPFACSQTPLQMQSRVQTMTSRTASFI